MLTPTFSFFEAICGELAGKESIVVTREDFGGIEAPLIDDLRQEHSEASSEGAIRAAVGVLEKHFAAKGSQLPFTYDDLMGRFTRKDSTYIDFVDLMNNIRTKGVQSRDFEVNVTNRLALKLTGTIHRVGWERNERKRRAEFNEYLEPLGFNSKVLLGKEKDGGLDILWLLPMGSVPHRPIISVQCKNAEIKRNDFERPPTGTTSSSLDCHTGYQPQVHMYCVLFNDYVESSVLPKKRLNFVPLGLSDLALPVTPVESCIL